MKQVYPSLKNKGFVTMSVVVILLIVGVSVTLFVLMSAWQADTGETLAQSGIRARWYADACAEHALSEIRYTGGYTGSESLTFDAGRCTIAAFSPASESFPVHLEGRSGEAFGRILVSVALSSNASDEPDGITVVSRSYVPEF